MRNGEPRLNTQIVPGDLLNNQKYLKQPFLKTENPFWFLSNSWICTSGPFRSSQVLKSCCGAVLNCKACTTSMSASPNQVDAIGEVHQVTSSFNLSVHDGNVICSDLGGVYKFMALRKHLSKLGKCWDPNIVWEGSIMQRLLCKTC